MINCKSCNTELQDGALFCNECGSKVESEVVTEVVTEEVKTVNLDKTNDEERKDIKFCNECGSKNIIDANVCTNCGNTFVATPVGTSTVASNGETKSKIKFAGVGISVFLIGIVLLATVVFASIAISNNFKSKNLEYILDNTGNQINKEVLEILKSNDILKNFENLLTESFEMNINFDDEEFVIGMIKKKDGYTYNINYVDYFGDEYNFVLDTVFDKNKVTANFKNESDYEFDNFSLDVIIEEKNDILYVELEEKDTDIFLKFEMKNSGVHIENGKIVFDENIYVELEEKYNELFMELLLDSEVANESSKEKEYDREFILKINTNEYMDLVYDFTMEWIRLSGKNADSINIIEASPEFEDFDPKSFNYEFESMMSEYEQEMLYAFDELKSVLPKNITATIKSFDDKVKYIDIADMVFIEVDDTNNYLNGSTKINLDFFGETAKINLDTKFTNTLWNVILSAKADGSIINLDFSWDLKTGDGSIEAREDRDSDKVDFNLFADKKGGNFNIITLYDEEFSISIKPQ